MCCMTVKHFSFQKNDLLVLYYLGNITTFLECMHLQKMFSIICTATLKIIANCKKNQVKYELTMKNRNVICVSI